MKLNKSTTWVIGLAIIAAYGLGGFLTRNTEVIIASLSSVVAIVFIGLGVQLGDNVQRSIWFRSELAGKE